MPDLSISVVIPAYRAAQTICRAVDSVLAQTHPAHEIIVVDDGSPDDLAEVVARKYGERVILIRQPNGGAASARNAGIDLATGELIAFLDADDYWEPEKLARQMAVFQKYPELGLVASRNFDEPPGKERVLDPKPDIPPDQVLEWRGKQAFQLGCAVWTGTVAVRRSVLGEHRFTSGLEPAEDRDLWIRIVSAAPAYMIAEPLATAVLEPGSLSRTNIDRDCSNMMRVVHRHRALLGRSAVRWWEAHVYARWAGVSFSQGNYRTAAGAAWRRLVREPFRPVAWWMLVKSGLRTAAHGRSNQDPQPSPTGR